MSDPRFYTPSPLVDLGLVPDREGHPEFFPDGQAPVRFVDRLRASFHELNPYALIPPTRHVTVVGCPSLTRQDKRFLNQILSLCMWWGILVHPDAAFCLLDLGKERGGDFRNPALPLRTQMLIFMRVENFLDPFGFVPEQNYDPGRAWLEAAKKSGASVIVTVGSPPDCVNPSDFLLPGKGGASFCRAPFAPYQTELEMSTVHLMLHSDLVPDAVALFRHGNGKFPTFTGSVAPRPTPRTPPAPPAPL